MPLSFTPFGNRCPEGRAVKTCNRLRVSRWHSVRTEWCIYTRIFSQPIFYNIKNSKNYYVPLACASTSRANRIPGSRLFSDLLEAWPNVISGELPRWVARPMAQPDGLNDHLFRGTFSNPNPQPCSDGKSEICGSPANISQGRYRFWHGAKLSSRFRSAGSVYVHKPRVRT